MILVSEQGQQPEHMLGLHFYKLEQGSEGVSNFPKVAQLLGDVARVRIHSSHFRPVRFALPLRALKTPVGKSELEGSLADN